MKKIIYGENGQQLGSTNDIGEAVHAYDKYGKPIGYYNKKSNLTFDAKGKKIGNGNLAEALVLTHILK
jgi:hypothetical protein